MQPAIRVKRLSKVFANGERALRDLSFEVQQGEIFGIIGLSGAGKTTLMRCLTLLDTPTEGTIMLSGEEITSLQGEPLRSARRKIGMVFQHFNLLSSRTAWENVSFPLEIAGEKDEEKARYLLSLVGLTGKENHYPTQLSGGEKQRLAIARALALKPSLLLCDEATSALDPKTTHLILDLLLDLNKRLGISILLITHDMDVIKRLCTQMAVLHHGEIVEAGRVTDLFAHPSHSVTSHLVQTLHHALPDNFSLCQGELLRLSFKGDAAKEPVISRMLKTFDVEANILLGAIDTLREGAVGNLVIELKGEGTARSAAIDYLKKAGVVVEAMRP